MPRNDEGEFELVLGNRQLLSVFFIVVVLLGVFFTMGYIVGRNSAPPPAESKRGEPGAIAINPERPRADVPAKPEPAKPAEEAKPAPVAETKPQPAAETKPEPPPAAPVEPPKPAEAPMVAAEPPKGDYVQAVVLTRPEGEVTVRALRNQGYTALLAPVPGKEGQFRVLVGPFPSRAELAKTQANLRTLGFKGAYPQRY